MARVKRGNVARKRRNKILRRLRATLPLLTRAMRLEGLDQVLLNVLV